MTTPFVPVLGKDLWNLHLGDSLVWLQTLQDASVDMLVADPPYSSGGMHRSDRVKGSVDKYIRTVSQKNKQYPEFYGDNRDQRSYMVWCSLWLAECHRILKDGAAVALFSDWRQLPTLSDAFQVGGFVWRGIIAWDKTEATRTAGAGYPRHQCEYILWGSKGPLPTRPAGTGLTIPGCLQHPVVQDKIHATEKPVALYADLYKIGQPGGVILDPFVGSGASGVAALRGGFRFLGCELSVPCYELARGWMEAEDKNLGNRDDARGQLPLLGPSE